MAGAAAPANAWDVLAAEDVATTTPSVKKITFHEYKGPSADLMAIPGTPSFTNKLVGTEVTSIGATSLADTIARVKMATSTYDVKVCPTYSVSQHPKVTCTNDGCSCYSLNSSSSNRELSTTSMTEVSEQTVDDYHRHYRHQMLSTRAPEVKGEFTWLPPSLTDKCVQLVDSPTSATNTQTIGSGNLGADDCAKMSVQFWQRCQPSWPPFDVPRPNESCDQPDGRASTDSANWNTCSENFQLNGEYFEMKNPVGVNSASGADLRGEIETSPPLLFSTACHVVEPLLLVESDAGDKVDPRSNGTPQQTAPDNGTSALLMTSPCMTVCTSGRELVTNDWNPIDSNYYINASEQLQPTVSSPLMPVSSHDAAKLMHQTVALDRLTVMRLRTECRTRRLPVSGKKRNLVRRLLPFADIILQQASSAAAATGSPLVIGNGCTAPVTYEQLFGDAASASTMSANAAAAAFVAPHSTAMWTNLAGFVKAENVDCHSPKVDGESTAFGRACHSNPHGSATATRQLHHVPHHDFCTDGNEAGAKEVSPPIDVNESDTDVIVGKEMAADDDEDEVRLPTSLRRSSDGSLTKCWVRQQRLIEVLHRQLLKYRKALNQAKCVCSTNGDVMVVEDGFNDGMHVTDGYPVLTNDETTGFDDEHGQNNCWPSVSMDFPTSCEDEPSEMSIGDLHQDQNSPSCSTERSTSSSDRQPPDYYEAVKLLGRRDVVVHADGMQFQNEADTLAKSLNASHVTLMDDYSNQFTIDDVMDILMNSRELPSCSDQRLQMV